MDNYIVSARKYRPSTFDTVVGQSALTTTLKNAIASNKLAHAYLFCGPRGVGKTTCARIFAKTINCLSPTVDGEACNECESCVAFNEQRSYNIYELDAASNNSVDDIRSLVEQVRIPPQIGKYKVYIIDEVHMLSTAAFNAFLKTLEEPPHHAIFILATTEKHKILPTILSRCQIYDFNRIAVEDIVGHLTRVSAEEGVSVEEEALHVIALKADGGMRDALSIFDQAVSFTQGNVTYSSVIDNLNILDYEYFFHLTTCFLAGDIKGALLLFNEVLSKGFEGAHFITGLAAHLRDLLVSKDKETLQLLEVGASIRERYKKQAAQCDANFLIEAMTLANTCDLNYKGSRNKRLLVELALIQITQLVENPIRTTESTGVKLKPIDPENKKRRVTTQQATAPIVERKSVKKEEIQDEPKKEALSNISSSEKQQQEQVEVKSIKVGNESTKKTVKEEIKKREQSHSIPKVNIANLGISITNPNQNKKEKSPTKVVASSSLPSTQDKAFSIEDLSYVWHEYIGKLPIEEKAMAARMRGLVPELLDATTFEVAVDNELVRRDFLRLKNSIEGYLQRRLQNSHITMKLRVTEESEEVRAYSRVDKFQRMAEKNKAVIELKDTFGLELY